MPRNFKNRFLTWLLLNLFVTAVAAMAAEPSESFIIGANTHFSFGRGVVESNLNLLAESGITSPRDVTFWRYWNPQKSSCTLPEYYTNYIDKALEKGLAPLQILCDRNERITPGYPNSPESREAFADFAAWMAAYYKGRCRLYQVFNEWDGGMGLEPANRTPEECGPENYAKLLAVVYPKMKKADPDCVVIANSVCITTKGFLEKTFQSGVLDNCDGFAYHAYNYMEFGENRTPEAYIKTVEDALELSKKYNNGIAKPIYLTEIGWPNHTGRGGSSEALSGDYLARVYLLARTIPEIKGIWWYDFQDDGYEAGSNESNFGIVTPDLTPKEPWFVMRSIAPVVKQATFLRRLASPDPRVIQLLFRMPDGTDVLAAWSTEDNCRKQIVLERGSAPDAPLQVEVAGHSQPINRNWGFREWLDANDNRFHPRAEEKLDRFAFSVTSRPVLVRGHLDGTKVIGVKTIVHPPFGHTYIWIPEQIINALPVGATAQKPELIHGDADYRRVLERPLHGDSDLSAEFKMNYDRQMLYLHIVVTDDVHSQKFSGNELWRGDSIQMAFSSFKSRMAIPDPGTEYQLGLTETGPQVLRESSQLNLKTPTEVTLQAKRTDNRTTYEIAVPFREIGVEDPKPGTTFGFSIVINDDDGKKREGYLHWGDGIGTGVKAPEEYNWVILRK